jgi:hypothetical protein
LGSADKHTSIYIADNVLMNAEVAACVTLKTDCTGILKGNCLAGFGASTLAAVLVGDNEMACFENYITDIKAVSGVLNPAGAAAD